MDIMDLRITHFENTFIPNQSKSLSFSRIKHKLKESFVFVPADKAANKIVV